MAFHVTHTLIRLVLTGQLPVSVLLRPAHQHLLDRCPACTLEREADQRFDDAVLPLPPQPSRPRHPRALPENDLHVRCDGLGLRLERQQRRTHQGRLARRQLRELLAVPRVERPEVIDAARSAYRTRAFAELLVAESRRRVKTDPAEAESLAALVPRVLHWIPGAAGQAWYDELMLQALAWRGNALRVMGDLPDAERRFAELRDRIRANPGLHPEVRGEILSLEASLRIGQRRPAQAARLLEEASTCYRQAGDDEELARVLLMAAGPFYVLGRPEDMLAVLAEAESLSDTGEGALRFAILCARVVALCQLGRHRDAADLLDTHDAEVDAASLDAHTRAVLASLRGRVALDSGRHDEAEAAFLACREGYLAIDRIYDAVLVSLDLARVYLEAGRLDELYDLAGDLVPQFRARGVARETLAALRLLAQAAAAREVSRELLRKVREGLQPELAPFTSG